jgi:hypothetical protein
MGQRGVDRVVQDARPVALPHRRLVGQAQGQVEVAHALGGRAQGRAVQCVQQQLGDAGHSRATRAAAGQDDGLALGVQALRRGAADGAVANDQVFAGMGGADRVGCHGADDGRRAVEAEVEK